MFLFLGESELAAADLKTDFYPAGCLALLTGLLALFTPNNLSVLDCVLTLDVARLLPAADTTAALPAPLAIELSTPSGLFESGASTVGRPASVRSLR